MLANNPGTLPLRLASPVS